MSITRRDSFQATIKRAYDFIHDDARANSATQYELHTRLNNMKTTFEKFQKEHFDIIIQPEVKDVENVFNEHNTLYESVEEMMLKTDARFSKILAAATQQVVATTSTAKQVPELSDEQRDFDKWLKEREERIDQQQVAILTQITQLDDRAMDIAKEEGIVAAMSEQVKSDRDEIAREKAELEEQKTNMRSNEKRLSDLADALRVQGDDLMAMQEKYESERREIQTKLSERERALDNFEKQLIEKSLRIQPEEQPTISPTLELELPRFSGHLSEFVVWNQLYEKMVHNVEMSPICKLEKLLGAQPPIIEQQLRVWMALGYDYDKIREMFNKTLQNKQLYVYMLLDCLEMHATTNKPNGDDVRSLIERTEQVWALLQPISTSTEDYEDFMVIKMLLAMPHAARTAWDELYQSAEIPKLGTVAGVMREIANKLDRAQNTANKSESANSTTTSESIDKPLERMNVDDMSEETGHDSDRSVLTSTISAVGNESNTSAPRSRATMLSQQESAGRRRLACHHCGQEHTMFGCSDYRRMSLQTRWMRVRELMLCANCLSPNHRTGSHSCRASDCGNCPGQLHNSSLCPVLTATQQLQAATGSANMSD